MSLDRQYPECSIYTISVKKRFGIGFQSWNETDRIVLYHYILGTSSSNRTLLVFRSFQPTNQPTNQKNPTFRMENGNENKNLVARYGCYFFPFFIWSIFEQ